MTERKKLEKITIANKFNYILDSYISGTEAQQAFGYDSPSYITRLRDPKHTATLNNLHLQILEYVCNIPKEVFEQKTEFDTIIIDKIINNYTHQKIIKQNHCSTICENLEKNKIFCKNEKLFESLKGVWYAYLYPSNSAENIYEIKTTIYKDGTVMDENKNYGKIYLGKRQSIIIKESKNSQNLVSITFDNMQVPFGMFSFTLVSKKNFVHRKMCSYGFFSKKELTEEAVKKILGNIEKVQLQLDYTFEERLNAFI